MKEDVLVKLSPGLLWQKLHLTRRGLFFTSEMDLELRKKLVKCYIWSIALYGAEKLLLRVKEHRNILHKISRRKANWIGHILRRNCLLRQVIEGKIKERIEVTGRRERRRRKLLDDLKERKRYVDTKEEALDRTMWRVRFGRGFEPVLRQTAK
jgi:hypothetical protein